MFNFLLNIINGFIGDYKVVLILCFQLNYRFYYVNGFISEPSADNCFHYHTIGVILKPCFITILHTVLSPVTGVIIVKAIFCHMLYIFDYFQIAYMLRYTKKSVPIMSKQQSNDNTCKIIKTVPIGLHERAVNRPDQYPVHHRLPYTRGDT